MTKQPATQSNRQRQRWQKFLRRPTVLLSVFTLTSLVTLAWGGAQVWRYTYSDITPDNSQPPSATHPLGTDSLGHDLLAQIMRGTQQSLLIALSVAVGAVLIGTVVGVVAGFYRGWVDTMLMRVVDIFLTLPVLAVAAVLGHNYSGSDGNWLVIAAVLTVLSWMSVARVVRGLVLELRERDFVKAARVLGASDVRIMLRHIVPNVLGPVIVAATILVATAILAETALSFLGFGVRPPDTSLGLLVASAQGAVTTRPWLFVFPGLTIIAITMSVSFIGEGLRALFDPKHAPRRRRRGRALVPEELRTFNIDPDDLLAIRDLRVSTSTGVPLLRGVNLAVRRGEILGVVGESGSGKSLTASAVLGLLPHGLDTLGSIRFGSTELVGATEATLRSVRGTRISMVFQDPMSSLSPVHTIGEQVAEALRVGQRMSRPAAALRATELLELVGIPDAKRRYSEFPHNFSGGMRQRVVIAIALANDPDLIIADEPTTALDVTVQAQVLRAFADINQRLGISIMLITHDIGVVSQMADRVVVMYGGRVVEIGEKGKVLDTPAMPYTRALLDAIPDSTTDPGRPLAVIPGRPAELGDVRGCAFAERCALATPECSEQAPQPMEVAPGHLAECLLLEKKEVLR